MSFWVLMEVINCSAPILMMWSLLMQGTTWYMATAATTLSPTATAATPSTAVLGTTSLPIVAAVPTRCWVEKATTRSPLVPLEATPSTGVAVMTSSKRRIRTAILPIRSREAPATTASKAAVAPTPTCSTGATVRTSSATTTTTATARRTSSCSARALWRVTCS